MKRALMAIALAALLLTGSLAQAAAAKDATPSPGARTGTVGGALTTQPTPMPSSGARPGSVGGALTTRPTPTPMPPPTPPAIGGAALGRPAPTPTPAPSATPAPRTAEEAFLDQLLAEQAGAQKDPWTAAILASGPRDVRYADGLITFSLRSYNPALLELGDYDAGGAADYLARLCANASRHDLACALEVTADGGALAASKSAISRLVKAARKAGGAAQSGFDDKRVRVALVDWLLAGEGPAAGLSADADRVAALFTPRFKQSLSVKAGPAALALTIRGADGANLADRAGDDALWQLARRPVAFATEGSAIKSAFHEALLARAGGMTKKEAAEFTFAMDVDRLAAGDPGDDFRRYVQGFVDACDAQMGYLIAAVSALPFEPAQDYPDNGRLSGSTKGTKVVFKARGRLAHYVQMRDAATGQSVVTLFVRPGESASVRVPKGEYYLLDACGPLWYGEQAMFAAIGYYEKTESITIKGSKYYHVIELDSDKGGNLESYQSSPFEFSLSPRVGAQT
ncbi:MAG: hypothetical protein GX558_03635 [Clostridiales bacterium]|nr:hypothetical protein [Clostridiales bacterium]